MASPQDRIAAGQELRRRGRLSPEQDAALGELEKRYGQSQQASVDENGIPLPSMGGVRRIDILPPAENKVPKWAEGLPDFAKPMFEDGEQKALGQWKDRIRYEMRPGAGGIETTRQPTDQDIDAVAINRWESAGRKAPKKDLGQMTSGLSGFADLATFGLSDEYAGAISAADTLIARGGSIDDAKEAFGRRRADMQALLGDATEQRPVSLRAGQFGALLAPGAKLYTAATTGAPKLVAPSIAARLAGDTMAKKGIRFTGRLGVLGGVGAADLALYNAAAERGNIARIEGDDPPTIGERVGFAAENLTDPWGWAPLPAASVAYRTLRGGATAGVNTARASMEAGKPTLQAGSLTPSDVAGRVSLNDFMRTEGNTARGKAIDMLLRRGLDPDDVEKLVNFHHYAGYSTVDEMLFELSSAKVDQLAVALGTVGGDAKRLMEKALPERSMGAPARIRESLRSAMGLEGDDFYALQKELGQRRANDPKPLYEAAYGREIADDTWETQILPILRESPSAREAVNDAAKYAADQGELAVAGQLRELAQSLGSEGAGAAKVSTHALDYIDRMLGDMAAGIRQGSGRKELAKGPESAQRAIRGSGRDTGLDPETGLNAGRDLSAELRAAEDALEFGRTGFAQNTDVETLLNDFAPQMARYGIDGEPSETIKSALLMGWLRGAEDKIATATNPGTVIRQIYGSERQREKLLAMMPKLPDKTSSGYKGDLTKRIRELVGGKRDDGRMQPSRIDRERQMFANQNRIIGNSQSAQRLEAVAEQGGTQRKADVFLDAVFSPRETAKKAARVIVRRATMPGIYNEAINRELGVLLTTSGRERLLDLVSEIRRHKQMRSGGNLPPGGGGGAARPSFAQLMDRRRQGPRPGGGGGVAASAETVRSSGIVPPGLRTDASNAAGGALGMGLMPAPSTGDFEQDAKNAMARAAIGAAAGFSARRLAGRGGSKTQGFGNFGGGKYRYGPTGRAFDAFDSRNYDQIARDSGGILSRSDVEELMPWYAEAMGDGLTPAEIVRFADPGDVRWQSLAQVMELKLTPMRGGSGAQTMGFVPRLGRRAGDASQQELPKAPAQVERRGNMPIEAPDRSAIPANPDQRITRAASDVIAGIRGRMAPLDDPRHYGPRMSRLGMPQNLDPNRPLYQQVGNQRAAAMDIARGGDAAETMARDYAQGQQSARMEARAARQARGEAISEKQAATRRLNAARKALSEFYGENGTHTRFRTLRAKRAEEARLHAAVREAQTEHQVTRGIRVDAARPFPPEGEQLLFQEITASRHGGYGARGRAAEIGRRTARMLLDPERATAGAFAARVGQRGFAPSDAIARAAGYTGVGAAAAGAGAGIYGLANAIPNAIEGQARRRAEREQERITASLPSEPSQSAGSEWHRMSRDERTTVQSTMSWILKRPVYPDAALGPETKKAIGDVQAALGLPVTGVMDARTRYALFEQTELRMLEYRQKLEERQSATDQ